MAIIFIEYPKCSTCQRAKAWLEKHHIHFTDRHIVENPPKENEIRAWIESGQININKLFNTSGLLYRKLGLKEKIKILSDVQKIALLSSDGMLIKRPILITNKGMTAGFDEKRWLDLI